MKKSFLILSLFATYFNQAQVNLSSSLTACYALNGNANDPINTLNGILSSVTPTVDRFNNANSAYAFGGSPSSYIQLPNSPLIKPNQVSFSAWVRFNSLIQDQYLVFAHNGCGFNHEGYMMSCENMGLGGFKFRIGRSGSNCNSPAQALLAGATIAVTQTWYHVGFYIGPDSLKLYVNGQLESTQANATPIFYGVAGVCLGGSNQSAVYAPFDGSMDNVRFYNRKLNGTEFTQLYSLDPVCVSEFVDIKKLDLILGNTEIFPNPSNGNFEVKFSASNSGTLFIYNSLSELVYQIEFENEEKLQIDLGDLANGIYYLKINNSEQDLNRKIIKN